MSTNELVAALVEHVREVREMPHQLGGRKLHIARHNWNPALMSPYRFRVGLGEDGEDHGVHHRLACLGKPATALHL